MNDQKKPSPAFKNFADAAVTAARASKMRVPPDFFERDLWAAAVFDWFRQSGEIASMVDGGGLPRDEVKGYTDIVHAALKQLKVQI